MFEVLNRRDFVRSAGGCSALTSISLMSTLLSLRTTSSLAAGIGPFPPDDYRALVCLFLFGGNDSFNMLAPADSSGFDDYQKARSNMALSMSDLLDITDHDGRKFGVHRSMPGIQDLYNGGKVAFVANVGSLVRPTTYEDFKDKNSLPLGLYSHSDLQRHWQTSVPQERANLNGWAGRVSDILTDSTNNNPSVSMSFSLGSAPMLLTGASVSPYIITSSGAIEVKDYGGAARRGKVLTQATDKILEQTYTNLLARTHAIKRKEAIESAIAFNAATQEAQPAVQFPTTNLGKQFEMVAKTIGARKALGQQRQVFFVQLGGFDNHNELLNNQRRLLGEVNAAVKAFYDATVEMGVANDVTTFTASDFSRTLSSNGNGTDHAWGGNHMVIGGAVKGGRIYGQYPDSLWNPVGKVGRAETRLEASSNRRGRLIPTTSVDEYNAELAMWFGIPSDDNLKMVLPNIENFMRLGSKAPLGFLA